MDIRECIEVFDKERFTLSQYLKDKDMGIHHSRFYRMSEALKLATQTLQDVADGKLIKPRERGDLKTLLFPIYTKWICDDPDCTQHDLEEVLNDIADALQGKV